MIRSCVRWSFLWLVLLGPAAGYADTYPRQPGVDVQHYIFRLTLSDETDEIVGQATVDVRFVLDGVAELALDLVSVGDGGGMSVLAVLSGGVPVEYAHAGDRLRIVLASAPHAGERRTFTVHYGGVPAGGLRIGPNRYGDRTFFSRNWPDRARHWLPLIDHPSDKATSEFIITAPAHYQVVANGRLKEELDLVDGRRLTHWKQSVPIASWLKAVAVAQFSARHLGTAWGVPLQSWVFHQDRDVGIVAFDEPTIQALAFFNEYIGPYPYEKLASVQAAGMGGGMEHATVIFYGENVVDRGPATNLVAHEIAHQWFGNSVTQRDWDDVWLSEGFATYLTLLNTEHYQGRDAFVAGLERSMETVFATEARLPGQAVIHDNLQDMRQVLNSLVYQKGAWVLHMLRKQVGDEAFRAGIRDYYRRYRDANTSTDEFRQVMEEHAGVDLRWFFHQWLRRPDSPVLEGDWRYDAAGSHIEIRLTQTQPGDPYRLPLEIRVVMDGETRLAHIEMDRKRQEFRLAAEQEPTEVVLDPDTWVLMRASLMRRTADH